MAERNSVVTPTPQELISLCAIDSDLYCRTFFPKAFRQKSPPMHRDIWGLLEDQEKRFVALEVFRGGGKTTLLRAFTSKRIAYGTSRTILYVSEAQDHSKRSLIWLKKQVEHNRLWASIFGLSPGKKWSDEWIEIEHKSLGVTCSVIAYGITGQVRGVNIDDYRPDLIIVDDACDLENTSTEDQKKKTEELIVGALIPSLAPRSDSTDAKMAMLQTPQAQGDAINLREHDPAWAFRRYSCFDDRGESQWPARWTTEELNEDKKAHVARNQLHIWLREMECLLTDASQLAFRAEWLKYWDVLPDGMVTYMGVDPLPPPSDRELNKGLRGKDSEAMVVIGVKGADRYLLEYATNSGHEPDWTIATFFRLLDKWHPLRARVEGIAYQRTLKWILEQEMSKRHRWVQINAVSDHRKKEIRIVQALNGIASNGHFHIHRTQLEFAADFASYSVVAKVGHDDRLDATAMALDEAASFPVDDTFAESILDEEKDLEPIGGWRRAP